MEGYNNDDLGRKPTKTRKKKRKSLNGVESADKATTTKKKGKGLLDPKTMGKSAMGTGIDVVAGLGGAFVGVRVGKWGLLPSALMVMVGHQMDSSWMKAVGVGALAGSVAKVALVDSQGLGTAEQVAPPKWSYKTEAETLKTNAGKFANAMKVMLMPWSKGQSKAEIKAKEEAAANAEAIGNVAMDELDEIHAYVLEEGADYMDNLSEYQQREIYKGNGYQQPFAGVQTGSRTDAIRASFLTA